MKTKLILTALLSFVFYLLSSQVPQGFNYQAIARDGTSPVTTPLPVRITIQSLPTGGTVFWEELHSSVIPNESGLFKLVVGTGTWQSGLASFSDIDWTVSPKYIKTEIDYGGWQTMGASELWTVPYSMVAKDLEGPLEKLGVIGKTTNMEETLFEVKNKDGQTIFAVYNEGVRINVSQGDANVKGSKGGFAIGGFDLSKGTTHDLFVVSSDSIRAYIYDDPAAKASKGGFAIGGFDLSKGTTNDYLLISPDSARIYVDNAPSTKGSKGGFAIGGFGLGKGDKQKFFTVSNDSIRMYIDDGAKGSKGGFAIGGFDLTKGNNASYLNVATDAGGIINPSENRILWYPLKNAFLTGRVLIDSPVNVGENSFATGFESKAKGMYSQAMGFKAIANGDYSTAIGKNAVANNINSFAFGENAKAWNEETYVFGRGAIAEGFRSYAFGSAGVDSLGNPTDVTYSKGDYSFAMGQGSQAHGLGAFSIGIADTAGGDYSSAFGYKNSAKGYGATAMGSQSTASGKFSMSTGWQTIASGDYSTSMGFKAEASGWSSSAIGYYSLAIGDMSASIGWSASSRGSGSIAIGIFPIASGRNALAMGFSTKAIGNQSSAFGYHSHAGGDFSTSMGRQTSAHSYASMAIGRFNDSTCTSATSWVSTDPLFVIGNGASDDLRSNAVTVLKNGNVGIGISPNDAKLNILATGDGVTVLNLGIERAWAFQQEGTGASTALRLRNVAGATASNKTFYIDTDGSTRWRSSDGAATYALIDQTSAATTRLYVYGGAWCTSGNWVGSDKRWKKNISIFDKVLPGIMELQAVNYDLRTEEYPEMGFTSDTQLGLIAQDVENTFPLLVNTDKNGYKAIAYDKLSVVLLEGMKEQQQQIESQQREIDELKALVNSMIVNQSTQANRQQR